MLRIGGDALTTGGTYVTPYLGATQTYYVAAEGGYSVPVEHQSGFDNSTIGGSSWSVGPFSVIDETTVLQYLYTAADIAASGGTAGIITSLAFNCTDVPLVPIPNFKIQMKTVPSSMNSLVWQSGMTEVYANPSFTIILASTSGLRIASALSANTKRSFGWRNKTREKE